MSKFFRSLFRTRSRLACIAIFTLATGGWSVATAADYVQTNLVSSVPGLATITDPLLVNPWGVSRSPTSPFWTSNQGTNTSTLYAVTGGTNVRPGLERQCERIRRDTNDGLAVRRDRPAR